MLAQQHSAFLPKAVVLGRKPMVKLFYSYVVLSLNA